MLEALAAISLAGNVLQFIEFLAELVSKSSEIRRHGNTVTDEEIETTTSDLIRMGKKLEHLETVEPTAATAITEEEHVRTTLSSAHK